jgi:hypothetical protein
VRREKLLAEAGDSSGTQKRGKRPPLEAATKQRLVKTEKSLCASVTVTFGMSSYL